MRTVVFSLYLVGWLGCGYVKSGQWDDDPGNWDRAFGQFGRSIPGGWRVVHSRYWRNPHFTYEGGYYFQIRVSPEGRHLLMQPDYVRLQPEQAAMRGPCAPRPSWFAPRGFAQYEIWGAKEGTPNYRLLIDAHGPDYSLWTVSIDRTGGFGQLLVVVKWEFHSIDLRSAQTGPISIIVKGM